MGYTTTFNGSVQIEPPFTPEEIEKLRTFSAQRHDEDGYPGIWCNWISTPEGDALIWDGTEKFYHSPD